LADADLNRRIVTGLTRIEPEIDIETAAAAALDGLPDSEIFGIAAKNDRVLISHDRRTMQAAFYTFLRNHPNPGLILVKQGCPVARAIEELRVRYRVLDAEEFANLIHHVPL
jgi:predicted nuclease of predicted toxin-antitoxin system